MAEPNERPADTRWPDRPVPGASGKHGEPNEDIGPGHMATNNRLEGAAPGEVREAPESRVASTSTGVGSDTVQSGSEAAGGSVVDKRPPDNKRRAEQRGSADAIGERLRDASGGDAGN